MSRRKPKVDEFILHMRLLERLMKRNTQIGVFGLPGEGKAALLMALQEKYQDSDWNFYFSGENPVESPFIFAFISSEEPVPNFDKIFCMQYSKDYKESMTGESFPGDEWHPLADYITAAHRRKMSKINITGKVVKNMNELKQLINGEVK